MCDAKVLASVGKELSETESHRSAYYERWRWVGRDCTLKVGTQFKRSALTHTRRRTENSRVKNVRYVFDDDFSTFLCLGQIEVGNGLINPLPSETNPEPSFVVEQINGNTMTVRNRDGRRGKMKFRCLSEAEWEKRFG